MYASLYGHSPCVSILINNGANVALMNEDCNTSLFLATMKDHLSCVSLLLKQDPTLIEYVHIKVCLC